MASYLPEIDDYDAYPEVDQALLSGAFPPVLERPRLVEIDGDHLREEEADGLVREIVRLEPKQLIVGSRSGSAVGPWSAVRTRGIELRWRHLVGPEPVDLGGYAGAPLDRLLLDLNAVAPPEWARRITEEIAPCLGAVRFPVWLQLSVPQESLADLEAALRAISTSIEPPAGLRLCLSRFSARTADDFGRLAALLLPYVGTVRMVGLSWYRLLRLFVDEDRTVLPLPRSPVRLGSLRSVALAEVWENSRASFWGAPSVRAAFENCYRNADLVDKLP
jgi:hypothetical protein